MRGVKASSRDRDGGGFPRWVELAEADADVSRYPFTLPVVAGLRAAGQLELDPAATFLVGDNSTGKSTLIEAIAVAAGFNPRADRPTSGSAPAPPSRPWRGYLRLVRGIGKPRTGFFLRAESFYHVATQIDRLGARRS